MLRSEAGRLKRVVVSTPWNEYYRVVNLQAHNILDVANQKLALEQHDNLKEILRHFNSDVVDLPELKDHPNSVFTRDAALCTPEGYIELRPGIETRLAEGSWMASALNHLGEPKAGKIEFPGTVDGGDVLLLDPVAFIGLSKRTNPEGCLQLSYFLEKMGYEIRKVSLPDLVLHLDKVLMPVGDDRLLVCTDIVHRDILRGFDIIGISFSNNSSANIICLGNGELIVGATNQGAIDALDRNEFNLHLINVSEFVKGSGGPNCLIMPVEREF
jgi:dimethylargininase